MGFTTEKTPRAGRQRRVTIVDVAAAAEVSVASASKVVRDAPGTSPEMRRRVLEKVEELGYRPHRLAQALRAPLKTIGVLVTDIENPFFTMVLKGAAEVFDAVGYDLFVSPAGLTVEAHEKAMESFVDHRMAGLLAIAPRGTDESLDNISTQVPTVVLGRHGTTTSFDTVAGNDARGAQLIVDHLVGEGHERIAFVANVGDDNPLLPENQRLSGYRAAMTAHGLEADIVYAPWTYDGGATAARSILDRATMPTAVATGTDVVGIRMLSELWDRGLRVPEDIALVGYDNSPAASFAPISLSSVDQHAFEMGRTAARLLLDRINGRTDSRHPVLVPALVVRKSSTRT